MIDQEKKFFLCLTLFLFLCGFCISVKAQEETPQKSRIAEKEVSTERVNGTPSKNVGLVNSGIREKLYKFEIGGHATIMFQGDFNIANVVFSQEGIPDNVFSHRRYESGFGGRFTFNINRNLALESELNFTPSTRTVQELIAAGIVPTHESSGGEKTQFLAGVDLLP